MTDKQRNFIKYYLGETNFNASLSYALAYDKDYINQSNLCRSASSHLLAKTEIREEINKYLVEYNMNYDEVLNKLYFIINQIHDLPSSLNAIKLYLKINGKLEPKELNVNVKGWTANFS